MGVLVGVSVGVEVFVGVFVGVSVGVLVGVLSAIFCRSSLVVGGGIVFMTGGIRYCVFCLYRVR